MSTVAGAEVRATRLALNLTQLQLSQRLGVTTRTIMRMEQRPMFWWSTYRYGAPGVDVAGVREYAIEFFKRIEALRARKPVLEITLARDSEISSSRDTPPGRPGAVSRDKPARISRKVSRDKPARISRKVSRDSSRARSRDTRGSSRVTSRGRR